MKTLALLAVAAAVAAPSGTALAAASDWWRSDHVSVRLIAASDAVGQGDTLSAGLQFEMRKGWKIYWRSPGDAGFPPQPDWSSSENLALADISWPVPERFSVIGLETLGYKHEVVLPLDISPFEAGKPIALRAHIPFLACADVCIPYEADVALDLPAGPETTTPEAGLIDDWRARLPKQGDAAPFAVRKAVVNDGGRRPTIALEIAARNGAQFSSPDVYVEGPPRHGFSAPEVSLSGDRRTAFLRVKVVPPRKGAKKLAGERVTLTIVDGDRAAEQTVPLQAGLASPPPQQSHGLAAILALALLGGLILNLMPCVLPVLSIKLLSVLGHGGQSPARVRRGFLASSAGIFASFLALGTGAVALRALGLAAGWGIQFQQPVFLAVMIVILVLFAANLWGLFEIRLPGVVAAGALRAGEGEGLTGHFLTGALATLLATPCSAPFLGTAIGFALTRGPAEIYAVFSVLGIGLALPYLLVAALPSLVRHLPRPGRWMIALRKLLAVALIATAVWFLTIVATQIGWPMAGMVAALMAAVLVALWPMHDLAGRARGMSWALVVAMSVLALGAAGYGGKPAGGAAETSGPWRHFDEQAIAAAVADGKIVVVDVTADWCLTCKVNKAVAFGDAEVAQRLTEDGVIAMQADWTRPDPVIAAYLARFGRYGIPFNAVYGPAFPGGKALPELLTPSVVLAAIRDAAVSPSTVAGK